MEEESCDKNVPERERNSDPAAVRSEENLKKLEAEIEARNSRDTKKKRRNWWIKTILMLLLIAASVALMFTINSFLSGEGTKSFSEMIKGVDVPCLLLFFGVVLLDLFLESAKYAYLLKISTGKFRLRSSIKTMLLGRYYDGITPLGTGGQPFQIYYLHKKDIPGGAASSIPLVRFIISTFVFCLIAFVLFLFAGQMDLLASQGGWGTTIMVVAWISMAANLLVPVAMIFVSFFPKVGKKITAWIVSVLSKVHIVKSKYPTMKKYVYEIGEYRKSLKTFMTNPLRIATFSLLCTLEAAVFISLPFFAMLAIVGPSVSDNLPLLYFQMCCLMVLSNYCASFVPTPGNSGASEAMTMIIFCTVSGINSVLGWIVLLWRFSTFYLYIISGIGINIFEIIRSAYRNRKKKA